MLTGWTSFNIDAGDATESNACDYSAEPEMRPAEGEGKMMRLLDIGNAIAGLVAVGFWFLSAKIFASSPQARRSAHKAGSYQATPEGARLKVVQP